VGGGGLDCQICDMLVSSVCQREREREREETLIVASRPGRRGVVARERERKRGAESLRLA
jgi:hypothetical protein